MSPIIAFDSVSGNFRHICQEGITVDRQNMVGSREDKEFTNFFSRFMLGEEE